MFGCSNRDTLDSATPAIRISPSILTRVSGLYFEKGDCIGLTIVRSSGSYIENCMMTYQGSSFAGANLLWYEEAESATFLAYFPYMPGGMIDEFSVATDQRGGCESSDLLGAVKTDVAPTPDPVKMVFYHLMSQVNIVVSNDTSAKVTGVVVSGLVPAAKVDLSVPTVTVLADAVPADIWAYEVTPDLEYRVMLVPQQAPLTVTVRTADGGSYAKTISAAALEGGRCYDLSIDLSDQTVDMELSGEIGEWVDGGSLDEPSDDNDPDGNDPDGDGGGSGDGDDGDDGDDGEGGTTSTTLEYAGETYATTVIGGKTWMAENLRYKPATAVLNSGFWYPVGGADQVATLGYLYNYVVAMKGSTSSSGVPVQGICPSGWHIPTRAELEALKESVGVDFIPDAGYHDGSKYGVSSTSMLLSCELDADDTSKYWILRKKDGKWDLKSFSTGYGCSLRCVKD